MVISLADSDPAKKLAKKGIMTLKWCYGPNLEVSHGKPEYYHVFLALKRIRIETLRDSGGW